MEKESKKDLNEQKSKIYRKGGTVREKSKVMKSMHRTFPFKQDRLIDKKIFTLKRSSDFAVTFPSLRALD